MKLSHLVSLSLLTAALTSCGQVNAPLNVIGDPSTIPELALPTVNAAFGSLQSTSGFVFNTTGVPIISPANGVIAEQTATSVTIIHSGRLSSRMVFGGVISTIVRTGDFVQAGQQISQGNFGGSTITFSTILDGKTVCPWSFLTQNARQNAPGGFVCSTN